MDDCGLLEHRDHRLRLVLGCEALASAGFVRVCSAVLSGAGGDGKLPVPGPAAFLSSAPHSVPKTACCLLVKSPRVSVAPV